MPDTSPTATRLLLAVEREGDLGVVEAGLREARDWQHTAHADVTVEVLVLAETADQRAELADRVRAAISASDAVTEQVDTEVRTVDVTETPTPTDAVLDAAVGGDVARVLLAADATIAVERLRDRLGPAAVEVLSTADSPPRRRLIHPGGWRRVGTVFALTYLFYLALGGFAGGIEYLTGAVSAGVVALSLANVAFREEPTLRRTLPRALRTAAILPVLLWEIAKANVQIAAIILHPRLPIDPAIDTVETEAEEGIEQLVLANSIALTPGTLPLDVREREFTVHSLTAGAREGLAAGRLQRLVAWAFHGRANGDETTASPESGGENR